MLTLNIIPKNLKQEIKNYQIQKLIKSLLKILFIFSILIILNTSISYIYLNNYIKNEINPLVEHGSDKKNIDAENKLAEISSKIDRLDKMQDNFIPWSNLLLSIAEDTPSEINYNQITINKADSSLLLKGFAPTREDLIKLRDSLKKNNFILELNFPVSNMLKKENINFDINTKINIDAIKQD